MTHSVICARNKNWRTIFDDKQPFKHLSYLTPTIFIYFGLQYFPELAHYVDRLLNFYVTLTITLLLNAVISTFIEIYNLYPISNHRPLKSYAQMLGVLIYISGLIIAVCKLLEKDPWIFISGIGALTAIIVLVFRDTILSFIAGIQILSNNLIKREDWIEVPAFGANGAVIDVALHVIKVQNWDKTVVTIPTYKVIESGFKNWRGMYDSGGRRIKRHLLIDQTSIDFMTHDRLGIILANPHVKTYMAAFINKFQTEHTDIEPEMTDLINLSVFRTYIEGYLQLNSKINKNMTFVVRLLESTPAGIPLEVYIFTKDTVWKNHEQAQSEIFEHLIAIMPIFGLRIFQQPTGYDFQSLQSSAIDYYQQKQVS